MSTYDTGWQLVTLIGPNLTLAQQAKGAVHVHKQDCGDIKRQYRHSLSNAWSMVAVSKRDVVNAEYADHIREGSMTEEEAFDDIWFAPCVTLPTSQESQVK